MSSSESFRRLNARIVQIPADGIVVALRSPTKAKHLRFLLLSGAPFVHVRLGTSSMAKTDIQTLVVAKARVTVDSLDVASDYNVDLTPVGGVVENFTWDATGDSDVDDVRDGLISEIAGNPGDGSFTAEANGTGILEIWRTNGELFEIAISVTGGTGTMSEDDPHPVIGGDHVIPADVLMSGNLYSGDVDGVVTHIGFASNGSEVAELLFYDVAQARMPSNSPVT